MKGLLNQEQYSGHPTTKSTCKNESQCTEDPSKDEVHEREVEAQRNGIIYVLSKERQLIPKLSDDEVMERHRMADENMKRVWSKIIEKYESNIDQGDVVDLTTGEIIEDNGHIRNLSTHGSDNAKYVSVLSDLLDVDNTEDNVWNYEQDDQASLDDQEVVESDDSDGSDARSSGNQRELYEKLKVLQKDAPTSDR